MSRSEQLGRFGHRRAVPGALFRVLGDDGLIQDFGRTTTGLSELAGVCFSPDASTLFVNVQVLGITLAITGPFRGLETAPELPPEDEPPTDDAPPGAGGPPDGCGGCAAAPRQGLSVEAAFAALGMLLARRAAAPGAEESS